MSEDVVHNCSSCEWLVEIGSSKACNAFAVPTDDVSTINSCSEWELKDNEAQNIRNRATAQRVTSPLSSERLRANPDDYRYLNPVNLRYNPSSHQIRTREIISDDYFGERYLVPHATEEPQRRQRSLDTIHRIIYKIERQKDYIIRRFNIEPTQVVIDSRTLREILTCREAQRNISYVSETNRKYWRGDLEIVECRPVDNQQIAEVLFMNVLI